MKGKTSSIAAEVAVVRAALGDADIDASKLQAQNSRRRAAVSATVNKSAEMAETKGSIP